MVPFWKLWSTPSNEWMNDIPRDEKSLLIGFSRFLFFIMIMTFMITSCHVITDIYGEPDIIINRPSTAESRLARELEVLDRSYLTTEQTADLMEQLIEKYDPVLEDLNRTMTTLSEDEIRERLESRGANKALTTRILEAMRNE